MVETTCPRCAGTMSFEALGITQDKVLNCVYCGHQIDVPDEVTIHREREGEKVTIHRRDLAVDGSLRGADAAVEHVRAVMGDDMAGLVQRGLDEAETSGASSSGKVVVTIQQSTGSAPPRPKPVNQLDLKAQKTLLKFIVGFIIMTSLITLCGALLPFIFTGLVSVVALVAALLQ